MPRPWKEIADEMQTEQDSENIVGLATELTEALDEQKRKPQQVRHNGAGATCRVPMIQPLEEAITQAGPWTYCS
jgi:hypothetical protein